MRRPEAPEVGTRASWLRVRNLTYADLPNVIAIERRCFPTPWSLGMFVLELSKPSGVCLAAVREGQLVGYLICARYETVWHLMNVAVAPEWRRQSVASTLLSDLYERIGDGEARLTLEVRCSNQPRSRSTNGRASARRGCASATTRTTARTRS